MYFKNHFLISFCLLLISFLPAASQQKVYNPLYDSSCRSVEQDKGERWSSSYMWYPGQLSAFLQDRMRKESKERCVNVGYPGHFNQARPVAYFSKNIGLRKPVSISWAATGSVAFTVDGEKMDASASSCQLQPGRHRLLFEVTSNDHVPAIIVSGDNIGDSHGWTVSLDGEEWNIPETDPRYNNPSSFPDARQESVVVIQPKDYICLRGAARDGGRLSMSENGRVIVDFFHLEVGQVRLKVIGNGCLRFTVGETPEEALNTNVKFFEQVPLDSVMLTGRDQEIVLPERALRYLAIIADEPCVISSVEFYAELWPVDLQMRFESDNQKLNDLWNAGVATLHASMHNFYLDGIKRDYLPWSMDAVISMLGGDYVFADRQMSRNCLSVALMPPSPQKSDWGIVDYPLHALIGLKHEYLRYGDLTTSMMFRKRIEQQLALYESVQDQNGFISADRNTSGFVPGWSNKQGPESRGIPAYAQMMLYENFRIGAYFARLWKDNALARHYESKAKQLGESIMVHFWDDERKAFINGYRSNSEKDARISHHAQYWGILTGLFPEEYYDNLFENILPSIPYYKEYVSYEKGYEFLAYSKAGRVKEMLEFLDEVWGDWLRQGNSRFPENFSIGAPLSDQLVFYGRPFGLSLCHGANGVPPIVAVLHGVLGFSQSDTSPNEYSLSPQLIDMEWARGRIPVKEGFISYEFRREGSSSIDIPDGCTVSIVPQHGGKTLKFEKGGSYIFSL